MIITVLRGFFILFLVNFSFLSAWDDTPKCLRDIEASFFQSRTILLALQYYQEDYSSQAQWDPFVRRLVERNSSIRERMRQAGKSLNRNPLDHPFDKGGAVKLLRSVTREVFMDAVNQFQPVVSRDWNAVFNYIFDTELERVNACLGEY